MLIADDQPRSREGLRALLATLPGVETVGEAGDGREALELLQKYSPDVVLMDARMPIMDGFDATRVIKCGWPQVKVVMLTIYASSREEALAAGVDAFLVKGCSTEDLLEAVVTTIASRKYG